MVKLNKNWCGYNAELILYARIIFYNNFCFETTDNTWWILIGQKKEASEMLIDNLN